MSYALPPDLTPNPAQIILLMASAFLALLTSMIDYF